MKRFQSIFSRTILIVFFFIVLVVIIAIARGYRINLAEKTVTSTGIISLSSAPNAAKIFVNDELRGVTNTNVTLPPGEYSLRISKEGFTEWNKNVTLLGEIVLSFEAVLFPKNPSLSPLTNLGVKKAIPVGQSDSVLLFSESDDPEKSGIYMLDGNSRRISLTSPLQPVVLTQLLPTEVQVASAEVDFAPDYREAIFTFPLPATETSVSYLMSLENENTELFDVTTSRESLINAWDRERQRQLGKILETFPEEIEQVATDSFRIIAFSPDETKILYQAEGEATLPLVIDPPLIGANQTEEDRTLETGSLYVYDRKEDKNFRIEANSERIQSEPREPTITAEEPVPGETDEEATNTPDIEIASYNALDIFDYIQWYPSSRHLVFNEANTISIVEYDGSNRQAVYSGPYDSSFFALNSDWKLLVLANLNPQNNMFGDIYEIGIR